MALMDVIYFLNTDSQLHLVISWIVTDVFYTERHVVIGVLHLKSVTSLVSLGIVSKH